VYFPDVNAEDQKRIFRSLLESVPKDDVDWKNIRPWLEMKSFDDQFNGRQIRNILSSAIDIARADKTKLSVHHIERVTSCTKRFQKYLAHHMAAARARAQPGSDEF